jgi:hypothetical protein
MGYEECKLPKLDVAGSIPVSRSIFFATVSPLSSVESPKLEISKAPFI